MLWLCVVVDVRGKRVVVEEVGRIGTMVMRGGICTPQPRLKNSKLRREGTIPEFESATTSAEARA